MEMGSSGLVSLQWETSRTQSTHKSSLQFPPIRSRELSGQRQDMTSAGKPGEGSRRVRVPDPLHTTSWQVCSELLRGAGTDFHLRRLAAGARRPPLSPHPRPPPATPRIPAARPAARGQGRAEKKGKESPA